MRRDRSLSFFPEDYVVLDIETTGLSPVKNEIIELSALRVESGEIKEEFSTLVKPIGYLSPYITRLTGISKEMLCYAPYIDDALLHFMEFISNSVVIGHNVTFDINFISQKLKECHNVSFENDYIDTLKLARRFLPQLPSKKLGLVAAHFNFNTDGMHRGLKDCIVTNLCYQKFSDIVKKQNSEKSGYIA